MSEARNGRLVLGPDGSVLTMAGLPPADTQRWVPRRKAEVVAAVQGGLLTLPEALTRYGISLEEFAQWEHAYEARGMKGLRVCRSGGRFTPPAPTAPPTA
jgi:hypothetical protein